MAIELTPDPDADSEADEACRTSAIFSLVVFSAAMGALLIAAAIYAA